MRTHGHREGSTTHWGLLGMVGIEEGNWGGIAWGEMPDVGEGEKDSKSYCHVCTMRLSCMFCTCTPEPKMQFKKKKNKI